MKSKQQVMFKIQALESLKENENVRIASKVSFGIKLLRWVIS